MNSKMWATSGRFLWGALASSLLGATLVSAQIQPLSDADKKAMRGNFGDIAQGKTTERASLLQSEKGQGTIAGQVADPNGGSGPGQRPSAGGGPGGAPGAAPGGGPQKGPGGPGQGGGGPPPGPVDGIQYHTSTDPRDFSGPWTAMLITGTGTLLDVPSGIRPGPQVVSPYEATRLCSGASALLSNGFTVLQRDEQITLLLDNDFVRARRLVMTDSHPSSPSITFAGNSIAHWEGNTLVVDTVALKGAIARQRDPVSLLFNHLLMATPTLHVVERFTKTNPSQLEVVSTFDDAAHDMKTYSMRVRYQFGEMDPDIEQICEAVGDLFGPNYTQGVLQ